MSEKEEFSLLSAGDKKYLKERAAAEKSMVANAAIIPREQDSVNDRFNNIFIALNDSYFKAKAQGEKARVYETVKQMLKGTFELTTDVEIISKVAYKRVNLNFGDPTTLRNYFGYSKEAGRQMYLERKTPQVLDIFEILYAKVFDSAAIKDVFKDKKEIVQAHINRKHVSFNHHFKKNNDTAPGFSILPLNLTEWREWTGTQDTINQLEKQGAEDITGKSSAVFSVMLSPNNENVHPTKQLQVHQGSDTSRKSVRYVPSVPNCGNGFCSLCFSLYQFKEPFHYKNYFGT
jgi:hypothetical protein